MAPRGRGLFVTLEGIDGSGKSTQARRLAEALTAEGLPVTATREPGGAPGAEAIRRLLVEGTAARWSPETELLLFTAARRDHLERVIAPALAAGRVVISDRFADSTRVYQGVARADLRAQVDELHRLMIGTEPDLTLIIDLDPAEAARRWAARGGPEQRFEAMGGGFQARLAQGFRALAREAPGRCRLIDGQSPEDAVAARVRAAADTALAHWRGAA